MKNSLPRKYALEDLLRIDPLGTLYAQEATSYVAFNEFDKTHRADALITAKFFKAMNEVFRTRPEARAAAQRYNTETAEGLQYWARLLDLPEAEIIRAREHQERWQQLVTSMTPDQSLLRSWWQLKKRAGITDVDRQNFPTTILRPMLVLYSADWCRPCKLMRPTFARLVPFFDKAAVRSGHDVALRKEQDIQFIPQFVAYFPNGATVSSRVGDTTQEVWDTMNNLITLGQHWSGKSRYACTEDGCTIIPQ